MLHTNHKVLKTSDTEWFMLQPHSKVLMLQTYHRVLDAPDTPQGV